VPTAAIPNNQHRLRKQQPPPNTAILPKGNRTGTISVAVSNPNAVASVPVTTFPPGLAPLGWTPDAHHLAAVALTSSEQLPQQQHTPQAGMMNNRAHLPAGQQVQGGADMGPAPTGGPVPGPRRGGRPQQHYPPAHHYHHHQHVAQPMYAANNYMAPYGGTHYYVPQPYQNAAIPNPAAYMPNPYAGYGRSSPSMQHFAPLQQSYGRPPQHSPIVSSPYQPPLPQASAIIPPLPHTPSSTHSYAVPPPMTPPVQQLQDIVPPPVPVQLPHQLAPQYEPQLVAQPKPQPEVHLPKPPSEPPVKASSTVSSTPPREPFRAPVSLQTFVSRFVTQY
jgi:hypothetical protein